MGMLVMFESQTFELCWLRGFLLGDASNVRITNIRIMLVTSFFVRRCSRNPKILTVETLAKPS